jgi:hypothetical protein
MNIIKQILKEFWLPFLGAVIWTAINYYNSKNHEMSWTTVVNISVPSFFFVSWLTGQYFRVKKQTDVTNSLSTIENRINGILTDITKQSTDMRLIVDTQLFQTFDLCLDSVREVKEELADRNRLLKKEIEIDLKSFSLYRENPFYQSRRFLSRLISYAKYTLNHKREEELEDRYTRTIQQGEELAGAITTLVNKLNHEKLEWRTPKTDHLLREIAILVQHLKDDILPHSKHDTQPYKTVDVRKILDVQINTLKKNSE